MGNYLFLKREEKEEGIIEANNSNPRDFLKSLELKQTNTQYDSERSPGVCSVLAIGPNFYAIGKDRYFLQIYDLKTREKIDQIEHDQAGWLVRANDLIIIGDTVYGFGYPTTFFVYKPREKKAFQVLKDDLVGSPLHGRTLSAAFLGKGIVYKRSHTALKIIDLGEGGGIRRIFNLKKLNWCKNNRVLDGFISLLVLGDHQNELINICGNGKMYFYHYLLRLRKVLRSYSDQITLIKQRFERICSADVCKSHDRKCIALSITSVRYTRSSRVMVVELSGSKKVKSIASLELFRLQTENINLVKIFKQTFVSGRFLIFVGFDLASFNNTGFLFCYDLLEGEIQIVDEMEQRIQAGSIHKAIRAFGGIYCVDNYGEMIGFELVNKKNEN